MGDVLILGGGVCGLTAAMMLARDGNVVTVLERDPSEPADDPLASWSAWDRPGVRQFQQPHNQHARVRHILQTELPDVLDRFIAAGAYRFDPSANPPPPIADRVEKDERVWTYTGRRPVFEHAIATSAANESNVRIVRGVKATTLLTGPEATPGVPHVVGVDTAGHGTFRADHVVDAMGRLSTITEWITAAGGRAPIEEAEDCRFAYYTRYFRSADGRLPEPRGSMLTHFPTFSILTLPGDNGTWSITIFSSVADKALARIRDPEVFTRIVQACPLQAHWLDGEVISDVLPMAGVLDRYRRFVVDDRPVVTGLSSIGDAWASTNPSAGRGIAVGLLHTQLFRDTFRKHGSSPAEMATAFDEATEREAAPWYWFQIRLDRARLAAVDAAREGRPVPQPDRNDPFFATALALPFDPVAFRAFVEMFTCITPPHEVFARPGYVDHVRAVAADKEPLRPPGPDGAALQELLA